jgi:TRAP-type C4-dicarboxylate transport system substrate-binding protein
MNGRKMFGLCGLAVAAALLFTVAVGAKEVFARKCTAEKPCKLVFSTCYKENFTAVKVGTWVMDEIVKRSNGRIVFERYYASSLLKALDTMSGCGKGLADLVIDSPLYSPDRVPRFIIETVCFLTADPWVHAKALNELVATDESVQQEWTKQNIHYFGSFSVTPCQLWLRNPISKMEDLSSLKIRAVGPQAAAFKAMGAVPVSIPFPDVYDALSKGTLDGVDTFPFDIGAIYKLHEVAPYAIRNPIGCFGVQTLEMNLNTYNSIPSDLRQLFDEVAEEASDRYVPMAVANDKHYMDVFIKDGGKVVSLSPAEQRRWVEVGKGPAEQWWLNLVAEKGIDGKPILEQFKGLIEKWEQTGQSDYQNVFHYYEKKYAK